MLRATLHLWILFGITLYLTFGEDVIFHSPIHHCIPPLLFEILVPIIFITPSACICALQCHKTLCHFYVYSEGKKECKIYGAGMSLDTLNSTYIDTRVAAPPLGAPLEEIAYGKNATAAARPEIASKAIDRNLTTYHESQITFAWWMVDLVTYHIIHTVTVRSRPDYFAFRFADAEFRVGPLYVGNGNLTAWPLIGFYKGPYPYKQPRFAFNSSQGICGRFVSVQRANSTSAAFSINEVEVFSRKQQ